MEDKDKLLVRVYDVGFGDCIYIRVPDKYKVEDTGEVKLEHRHILIDCGSIAKQDYDAEPKKGRSYRPKKRALEDVREMLPEVNGKRYLDLLVVTHLHADHINGFYPERFEDIVIRHVWLSAFMNQDHPQAQKAHTLDALARTTSLALLQRGLDLGAELRELLLSRLKNDDFVKALRETLSQHSEPRKPLYVCRDIADPDPKKEGRLSAKERKDHKVQFEDGSTCFLGFGEEGTHLRVLAPEFDIDGYYLGEEAGDYQSLLEYYPEPGDYQSLLAFYEYGRTEAGAEMESVPQPANISNSDFRGLRRRLLYSALRFSQEDDHLKNNTSVVLLLEWRGRRLLFTGDAEWGGGYDDERDRNSCWDVMLKKDEELHWRKRHLLNPRTPLDFLKVGHHGSENATPWDRDAAEQPILETILPKVGQAEAAVVVSTCRTKRWSGVPCPDLISALSGWAKYGKVLMTNELADLNYPEGDPFAVEMTFDAVPG